jgi:23S rRNA pseudouridine1911/1915/1917 synthase
MTETQSTQMSEELIGMRLDAALARLFPEYSRSQLTQWLRSGALTVDDGIPPQRQRVKGGERIQLRIPEETRSNDLPQEIPLDIIHSDPHVVIVNKPAGLVVHPAAGHREGTLVNALLHRMPELATLPRAGIVHRLDKDTTGLLMIAREPAAQAALTRQLQARTVHREYLALVQGRIIAGGTVDASIGRHPVDRKRMSVNSGGREAVTHYRVRERLRAHSLLELQLETGRTHQIRVHMTHLGYPVVGDPAYGGRPRPVRGMTELAAQRLLEFRRQALHAAQLSFTHPATGELVSFEAPLPDDFQNLLDALRLDAQAQSD